MILPPILTLEDIPYLNNLIKDQKVKADAERLKYATNDKQEMSMREGRHLRNLTTLKEFVLTGAKIENYSAGLVIIDDKFIASLASNKWRVEGKNKWYRYKSPSQLVDKYVRK